MLIKVRNNDIERAISKLKRKVNDEGILRDLRKHEYHMTKSQKRRIKRKEAIKRANKLRRIKELNS